MNSHRLSINIFLRQSTKKKMQKENTHARLLHLNWRNLAFRIRSIKNCIVNVIRKFERSRRKQKKV